MNQKAEFKDFLAAAAEENQEFVKELHDKLMELGCKIDIKSARSGYVVSYSLDKKTVLNYVFRKKGMLARIYGVHVNQYTEVFDTFPDEMIQAVLAAPPCKRMIDPDACNPKCSMGYDFWLKSEHCQKCRSSAFMFLVCPENQSHIQSLILREVKARKSLSA
ncbi:hypothetical protein [Anaerostipes sp.]|uniref:hypothetical protein n=1 Tax=Anaerostipes sp. TaxID=1872530 RepID=UPI0025C3CEB5|nr:hypothetical protein [Anaerostipes sp.]MBS7008679.1 hypothetical protein [Anaerostipes sp.]